MAESHRLGTRGEEIAARYLERAGWRVLQRNWRFHHKEIDLIARRGRTVAFVEVKTRARLLWGHPLCAISRSKRLEIESAARAWVARHAQPGDEFRFDAVAVYRSAGGALEVEHLEDAWRL